ncbi:hypothetical protein [Flavobacterium geliluteum]|uniref:Sugar ABC transporter ATPase n=1 Tax=Flavobacterium geliluteum TaxID=2816120 RepID=A0A940X775_9FLAO|nr:hypothetical protein [Flavobacterium geliluteum]MBP4137505.1 hypothetical protein [Flavobacterium geliluteum]
MSDHSISIVPRQSSYPDKNIKAQEILTWLISQDIVKPTLTDCILSSNNGYSISHGAKQVTNLPDELPFNLITNGLEIITERNVFHAGETGIDECICPNCKQNIASEDWDFLNDWAENKSDTLTCPLCKVATDIQKFSFLPVWAFSDLGFTFWNWPNFTDEFLTAFRHKLGGEILLVHTHI